MEGSRNPFWSGGWSCRCAVAVKVGLVDGAVVIAEALYPLEESTSWFMEVIRWRVLPIWDDESYPSPWADAWIFISLWDIWRWATSSLRWSDHCVLGCCCLPLLVGFDDVSPCPCLILLWSGFDCFLLSYLETTMLTQLIFIIRLLSIIIRLIINQNIVFAAGAMVYRCIDLTMYFIRLSFIRRYRRWIMLFGWFILHRCIIFRRWWKLVTQILLLFFLVECIIHLFCNATSFVTYAVVCCCRNIWSLWWWWSFTCPLFS